MESRPRGKASTLGYTCSRVGQSFGGLKFIGLGARVSRRYQDPKVAENDPQSAEEPKRPLFYVLATMGY